MGRNLRRIVSTGAAYLFCVTTVLPSMSAVAGVERWTAIGPDGANVVALVIDPSAPLTAFAGTMGSGVLKTTDGGASWATANLGLTALAIDPATFSTLYAGTDAGVFKSTNGGQAWSAASAGLDAVSSIDALAVDPVTPATLYAGTSVGVFKSTNGAASWTSINGRLVGFPVTVITIDPTSPSTVYVGSADETCNSGVFKSTDGGTSWQKIYESPLGFMAECSGAIVAIAIDSRSPPTCVWQLPAGAWR